MWLAVRMGLYAIAGFAMGQGFDFYQFDEQTGQVDISFRIDDLTTFVAGAVTYAGTFAASFLDRVRGPGERL